MLKSDIGAIFEFLCTTQGQLIVEDLRKVNAEFINLVAKIVQKVHDRHDA